MGEPLFTQRRRRLARSRLRQWRPRAASTRLLGALLSAAVSSAPAQTETTADDAKLQDLMALLEQETELATRSGMNADFVPGMATILLGENLMARGVRNVGEALTLVPGISQGLEMTGERQILSRGVGYGYASGNLKVLLDGVSMNSTLYATANPVLNIPIEQVERIEVIRGPGASVHGEYAFAGVIDVITRKRQRNLSAQAMDGAEHGGGGSWYWEDPERDLSASFNVLGLNADAGVDVDGDALHALGQPELSHAPGPSNESHRYRALFANLNWGDVFAAIKVLDDDYGDYFGINHFLPPDEDQLASRQGYHSLQFGANLQLGERLNTRLRLEALRYQRDRDDLFVFPAGYLIDDPVIMSQDYQETRYLAAADIHWRPNDRHQVLFGLEASQVEVDAATWDWPASFAIDYPWLDTSRNRRVLSLIAQDEYRISDRVTLTGALRVDDYSDADTYLSPRLAAVWRINSEHILKLQFAQAFRPPTFYELEYPADGRGLEAGEIATYELGYVLRKPNWKGRVILFQSDLINQIIFGDRDSGYINSADARLRGVELEYEQRLGPHFRLDANLSYVDSHDFGTGRPLPGGTDLLGNLALLWRPLEPWTAALQLSYVGERERRLGDERAPVGAYTTADLTLSYGSASGSGVYAHLGVKNLTDADVRYPEQSASFAGVPLTYVDDYPRPGRRWWLSVGYAF
ncbi:TonB-dependent receptor plug domain-containing protein [Halochromatium roseum]|uniref:TonB-dependent receptor plug domain-containing protein n=1 Tax=Halochromatium roseum TaxID=391920 RepID=UPI0019132544|nr:TonB-dependent receptor [Halochromatium roseum]MBK5940874.1 TonB-dependent receptor [Halochromatium roseum]